MLYDWFQAASRGDAVKVRKMLRPPNEWLATAPDLKGFTALHLAIAAQGEAFTDGHLQVCRHALGAGADPEALAQVEGMGRCTPLILAASLGADRLPAVTLLLIHGAKPNARGSEGITALTTAARYGAREICDALVVSGAEMTPQDAALLGEHGGFDEIMRNFQSEPLNGG